VVEVGHPAALLPRQTFQEAFYPLRALGLECLPQPSVTPADVHSLPPGKLQTIGGSGEVVDAAVNAYDVAVFRRKRDFTVYHNIDVELLLAPVVAQDGRSRLLSSKQAALEIADGKRELEPACYRRNGNFPALLVEGEGALVEAHAGGFELSGFGLLPLFLGCFSYSGNGTDYEVGLQAVFFLNLPVAEVLEFNFVGSVVFLGDAKDVIAGVSEPLQGFQKDSDLFSINLELAFNCFYELHSFILHHIEGDINPRLPPRLKSRGFRRGKGW